MSGIMEDLDSLQKIESPEKKHSVCNDIKEALQSLSKRVLDARFDWDILNPNAAREVVVPSNPLEKKPYSAVDENGNLLFDSLIYYKSLQLCVEMGIYFSTVFFLRSFSETVGKPDILNTLTTPLAIPQRSNTALKLPQELPSYRDSAIEICRSVEYYLQSGHGISGAYFLLFPLRVAQYAFEETEAKDYAIVMWMRKVMKYIGDEYGFSNALRFAVADADDSRGS